MRERPSFNPEEHKVEKTEKPPKTETISDMVKFHALQESQEYFEQRKASVYRLLNNERYEIKKILEEMINGNRSTDDQIAKRLGVDKRVAVKLNAGLLVQGSDGKRDVDQVVDEVIRDVVSSFDPQTSRQQAARELNEGKGWYFETEEGRSALKRIKAEIE